MLYGNMEGFDSVGGGNVRAFDEEVFRPCFEFQNRNLFYIPEQQTDR